MKKILIAFAGLIFSCGIFVLIIWLLIKLDIATNPYIKTITNWKWWNYITSHHSLTVLYLHHNWLWIIVVCIPGLIMGISFVFYLKDRN